MSTPFTHAMAGEWNKIFSVTADKTDFDQYQKLELELATKVLENLGYILDATQVHTGGERFVMSGYKLVLTGINKQRRKVVIKFSSHPAGREEIKHEHFVSTSLQQLDFAAHSFAAPTEFEFRDTTNHTFRAVEYVEEKTPMPTLPTTEQFFLALRAFEVQSGLHATTSSHIKKVNKIFGLATAKDYLRATDAYATYITDSKLASSITNTLKQAKEMLHQHTDTIRQYTGFLTHTDFAPHNVRLVDGELYLLDQTSLHFGNKHESWARFINYMYLYNTTLAQYLITYTRDNKSPEEYQSLRLMQLYKLIYLLAFYVGSHQRTSGNHQQLSAARLQFWSEILTAVQSDQAPEQKLIDTYKTTRNKLRDKDEKVRQRALGQL